MQPLRSLVAAALLGMTLATPTNVLSPRQGASITCPSSNNTIAVSNNKAFIVECGIDHAGGDLPNQPVYVNGIGSCIVACSNTPECVDFTLSGSACYMKGSVGQNVYYDSAMGAKLLGPGACLSSMAR